MVVGVRDHIEVWAAEKWERYVAGCDAQYEQLAELALVSSTSASEPRPAREKQDGAAASAPAGNESVGRTLPR
jgi:hypothetical protein